MICDKCGQEYPSQYYFNFNAVPGRQICTACIEAISPKDLAELRETSRIPKRPEGLRLNEFVFPQKCCSCLGPAETTVEVSSTKNYGPYYKTWSIRVPVCRSCSQQHKIPVYFFAGGTGLGALIGALGGGAGVIVGGFVGFWVGALTGYTVDKAAAPASIDKQTGFISFRNPKYDALFRAANSRF